MKKENLRRYVRVQFSRLTEILFLDLQPLHAPLIDLSLSGMFIEEDCEFDTSGSCTITYVFLQTLLLYKSKNPATVGEEFLKECPFTILDTNNGIQRGDLPQIFTHFQNIRVVNHANYKNQPLAAIKNNQLSTVTF